MIKKGTKNITQEEGEKMITISQSAWDSLQKEIGSIKKNESILLKIADKKVLSKYYQRNKKDLPLLVHVRELNGKIVVGWDKMPVNDVKKISQNKWIEDQRVKVVYEDGSKDEMTYVQFQEGYALIQCKRMGVVQRGNMIAYELVRLDNGEKYTIDVRFVN